MLQGDPWNIERWDRARNTLYIVDDDFGWEGWPCRMSNVCGLCGLLIIWLDCRYNKTHDEIDYDCMWSFIDALNIMVKHNSRTYSCPKPNCQFIGRELLRKLTWVEGEGCYKPDLWLLWKEPQVGIWLIQQWINPASLSKNMTAGLYRVILTGYDEK